MVSTSTSSIQNSFKYDVFISFRGEDTRKTFVGHLYQALKDKGIYTYKDDEKIEQGKTIDNQLIQAIRGSRFFIIVFSQNYASSSWCLDELVEIMECQKTGEQTAYPVFFNVEPTQVRKQSEAFGKAFSKNKKNVAAEKWKGALKEAADLAGWQLKNPFDTNKNVAGWFEYKFIQIIVKAIFEKSFPLLHLSNKRLRFSSYPQLQQEDKEPKIKKSSLASTSTSNSFAPKIKKSSDEKRFKYDVFISFRGEDTRKNFVDHLYHALKDKGIYTYKDDEKIQKGKRISDDLFQSIQDSKFYIIVFSKNYASSSWCLEELVKIMECQKITGHTAYPVFYDVEPTEVRKQSGAVGKAFAKHEKEVRKKRWAFGLAFFMKKKKAMLKKWKGALKEAADLAFDGHEAKKWKGALKEAASLAGLELKNTLDGHEAKFIKKIVHEISLELRSIDFGFDEKLVGMKTRVKDFVSSLEDGINEVRMIGIKGMGGAGKTTLARAVFDHISADFEAISFVENVREVTNASMFDLKKLQEQVLSKVLNEHVTLDSVTDGKNMMKERMCGKKVLLVLDDVDHIEQLKALAGEPKWFKSGSRILITTRDEQVLVAHGVKFIHDIVLLSEQEAISLFSRYAFGRENPLQGYEELSGKVLRYAAGLPLTIKVLGSFLCGKDKDEWVDAIERLKKIPLEETLKQLELSYISLEDDYKEIFLDIACILKGEHKKDAIRVLESCGFYAKIGLKVLEQRSLITVDEYGRLDMHDHIEEMGKNIVCRSHPKEPNKHSHLWIQEEIEDILANDMGTEATRSLKLDMSRGNSRIVMKGLGKMKKLRYLEVNYERKFENDCESDDECLATQYFPNSLEYLKCGRYPFLYLPRTFQANNLVGLCMSGTKLVQLWEEGEKKVLKKLKFLFLYSYLTTFDFGMTPNLETLSLRSSGNYKLKEFCMPDTCQKLKHLYIWNSELRSFDLGLTPNLETLYLESSGKLKELYMPVSCQKLNHLCITDSKLRTFDLGLTPNLETLYLNNCVDFEELHVSVACPNLKFLYLCKSRLRSLDLELIPNLERLDLDDCDELVEINAPIGCLKKVVSLYLNGCALLEKLPEDIGRLECLEELDITDTGISHLPQSIFGLKGLLIAAPPELLELYDFPLEIETTTFPIGSWLNL